MPQCTQPASEPTICRFSFLPIRSMTFCALWDRFLSLLILFSICQLVGLLAVKFGLGRALEGEDPAVAHGLAQVVAGERVVQVVRDLAERHVDQEERRHA